MAFSLKIATQARSSEYSFARTAMHFLHLSTVRVISLSGQESRRHLVDGCFDEMAADEMAAMLYVVLFQQVTEAVAVGLNGTIHRVVQFFSVSGSAQATSTFYVSQYWTITLITDTDLYIKKETDIIPIQSLLTKENVDISILFAEH